MKLDFEEKAPYLLLLANMLIVFSFIPFAYEVSVMKMTSNIPILSLIGWATAFVIFMIATAMKKYWLHVAIYLIGLICVLWMFVNKNEYDVNYTKKIVIQVEKS